MPNGREIKEKLKEYGLAIIAIVLFGAFAIVLYVYRDRVIAWLNQFKDKVKNVLPVPGGPKSMTIGPLTGCHADLTITPNGDTLQVTGKIYQCPSCTNCIDQIVIGNETTAYVIYNGIATLDGISVTGTVPKGSLMGAITLQYTEAAAKSVFLTNQTGKMAGNQKYTIWP